MKADIKNQIEDKLIEVIVSVTLEALEVGAVMAIAYLRQKKHDIRSQAA